MLIFADEGGEAAALAAGSRTRSSSSGSTAARRGPWLPHLTVLRFARGRGYARRCRSSAESAPSDAAVFSPGCARTGRGTRFSKRLR